MNYSSNGESKEFDIVITDEFTIIYNGNELQNSDFFCLSFSIWLNSSSVQVTNRKAYAKNFEFWKSFLISRRIEGINIT